MFGANIIARVVKLIFLIPIITSVRNNEISKIYKILYKLSYRFDNLTTFNSSYALKKFIREKITNPSKSVVINNAIDVVNLSPKVNNREDFNLISIAHFRPQKDYKTLFEAIALVKNANYKIKLQVLGHLYDQTWPYEMINELGIKNEVTIVGFSLTTQSYLEQSDALVLSSKWEGTPNAILEGMMSRLPIIASKIPGNTDLVLDANCGYLFEVENAIDLKDKIIMMLQTDQNSRINFGENGYNYVISNYEASKVHKVWLQHINSVLSEEK